MSPLEVVLAGLHAFLWTVPWAGALGAGAVDQALPWGGAAGIIGVVAFALKLLVTFQRDFTDRYSERLREQDRELASLRAEQRATQERHLAELEAMRQEHRDQMRDERAHRRSCEEKLRRQERLVEDLTLRVEGLDRRRHPRPDPPTASD